jgi:SAM-dependent methyltransferase
VSWQTAGDATADDPDGVVDEVDRANMARVYSHWIGGRDTYPIDREVAEAVAKTTPLVMAGAQANRAFLGRAVTYLARAGIHQFLDIGAGMPSGGNVHEVAQGVNPQARTIYVDRDDIVIAHARALLACDRRTRVLQADVRDPASILDDALVKAHLDWSQPVAVLFVALLHFVDDDPAGIVKTFCDALAPGSFVVISHVADLGTRPNPEVTPQDGDSRADAATVREAASLYQQIAAPFTLRIRPEIQALFGGLEMVPPGLVPAALWRADPGHQVVAPILAGVGRVVDLQREGRPR